MSSPHNPGPEATAGSATRNLEEELLHLAGTSAERFLVLFRNTRELRTPDVARACMRFLVDHGTVGVGEEIRIWLTAGTAYLDLLLDPAFLTPDQAKQVLRLMRDASLPFAGNLQRQLMGGKIVLDPERIDRAIHILETVIDPGILIPWLRNLTQVAEPHIRSKAAKALCAMRPNLMMIERQLKNDDGRVRANALEALWHVKSLDAIRLFNGCLNDDSHRVRVNALIGLHRLEVAGAFDKLVLMADDAVPLLRRAALWGMGFLGDRRAIPVFRKLADDPDSEVRAKAAALLAALAPEPEADSSTEASARRVAQAI
ncbi:MAG TPA: HEAT repeat domain-containing protein [Bryobacteraceae bacterium]|nr:HEAT repeat domain-containing protein [Bryobacteraceae bacterium]